MTESKSKKFKYKICGSYQVQDCTGSNGIVHHARRMTRCCNISSCVPNSIYYSIWSYGVRDAQCHRWYSLVPSVPNSKKFLRLHNFGYKPHRLTLLLPCFILNSPTVKFCNKFYEALLL